MSTFSASTSDTVAGTDVVTRKLTAPRGTGGAPSARMEIAFTRRNPAMAPNLVLNPSFETAISGGTWGQTGPTIEYALSTADFNSGSQSILMAPTTAGQHGIQQSVPVVVGQAYTLSAFTKRVKGSGQVFVYLHWRSFDQLDLNSATYPVLAAAQTNTITSPIGSWVRNSFQTLPAPPGASHLACSISYSNADGLGNDSFYLDDVQVEAGPLTPYETTGVYDTLISTSKTNSNHTTVVTMTENAFATDVLTRTSLSPRRAREVAASRRNTAYGTNYVQDADMENGFSGLSTALGYANTGGANIWSKVTSDFHSGIKCIQLAPVTNAFLGVQQLIDVPQGAATITVSAWFKRTAGNASFQSYFFFMDVNGAATGTVFGTQLTPAAFNPTSDWRRFGWTWTVPAGAVRFQMAFAYPGGSILGDTMLTDDWQVEVGSSASPFDVNQCWDTLTWAAKAGSTNYRSNVEFIPNNGYYLDETMTAKKLTSPRSIADTAAATDAVTKRLAFQKTSGDFGHSNLVQNRGFEANNTADFLISTGNGTLSSDTAHVRSGSRALKYVGGTVVGNVQNFSVAAEHGVTYTASCWVYVPSGSGVTSINTGVQWFKATGSNGYIAGGDGSAVTAIAYDAWNQVTATFALGVGVNVAGVNMYLILAGLTAGQAIWTDDWTLTRGSSVLVYGPDDSPARILSSPRALADAVAATDVLTKQLVAARALADAAPWTDAVSRAVTAFRDLVELVDGWTETVTRIGTFGRITVDSITWTDELAEEAMLGAVRWWNGTAWVYGELKRWNGSGWVHADLKRWDGAAWVHA